jgi:GNAT superfamily N-acetyltransferase
VATGGRDFAADPQTPYVVRAVTADMWGELADFFGPSGAYSHCWCVYWRVPRREFDAGCREGGQGNRAVLERLTRDGRVPGLIAYDGGLPVGWVSVAPREEYGSIERSPSIGPDRDEAGVWSVPCFWIPRAQRRRGVATALLSAAVAHAASGGADAVEAYPVDVDGRLPAAEAYTGTVSMFERAGFSVLRRPARGRRLIMRRALP